MRSARTFAVLAAGLVLLPLLAPTALAGLLPEPASQTAARQDALFRIINGIALVIGIVVEVLLVAFLVKFHRNKDIPRGETYRGNTKAEIAWTFAPVVVLVFIAYQSVVVMETTDATPEEFAAMHDQEAVEIHVFGNQFIWEFRYPDPDMPPSFESLRIQEGTPVVLNLTARDVGHAFRVPELGLMVDTWPNRFNHVTFVAPAFKEGGPRDNGDYIQFQDAQGNKDLDPNVYFVQCQEYCGSGHGYMRSKIVVFKAGTQALPYGSAQAIRDVCADPLGDRQLVTVTLREHGGSPAWSIDPPTMQFAPGTKVRFEASIQGASPDATTQTPHNFALLAPIDEKTPDFQQPNKQCLDIDIPAAPATVQYMCAVPGHADLGMRGTLTIA